MAEKANRIQSTEHRGWRSNGRGATCFLFLRIFSKFLFFDLSSFLFGGWTNLGVKGKGGSLDKSWFLLPPLALPSFPQTVQPVSSSWPESEGYFSVTNKLADGNQSIAAHFDILWKSNHNNFLLRIQLEYCSYIHTKYTQYLEFLQYMVNDDNITKHCKTLGRVKLSQSMSWLCVRSGGKGWKQLSMKVTIVIVRQFKSNWFSSTQILIEMAI